MNSREYTAAQPAPREKPLTMAQWPHRARPKPFQQWRDLRAELAALVPAHELSLRLGVAAVGLLLVAVGLLIVAFGGK